jgi:hypothetical protein
MPPNEMPLVGRDETRIKVLELVALIPPVGPHHLPRSRSPLVPASNHPRSLCLSLLSCGSGLGPDQVEDSGADPR